MSSRTSTAAALAAVCLVGGAAGIATWQHASPNDPAGWDSTSSPGAGPALDRLWSLRVQESDSFYLGKPSEISLDPGDGSFYVSDRFFGRIVHVARDGSVLGTFGRKGRGPGELVDVGQSFVSGGRLFVTDVASRHLSEFDARSGVFVRNHPYDGMLTSAVPEGEHVWLGLQSPAQRTGAARWTTGTEEFHHFAGFPEPYRRSQPLAGIFTGVSIAAWNDTVVVAFQGSDDLLVYSKRGEPLDTVRVPARARRGVPNDIAERLEKIPFPDMFRSASFLFGMHRLPAGELALVHFDQEIEGRAISSTAYVSVLSPDRKRGCIDRHLPVSRDAQPHLAFRGDTLFVLEQRLNGDDPEATVTAYRISSRNCGWTTVE